MLCTQCQYENPPGMKFCGECGTQLQAICPTCQAANLPTHKFCGECGEPLGAPTRQTGPCIAVPRYTSLQTYTPQHLAERIISSRGALEGERKQVTVLFADLKGSMELLADRDPEEARRILDPILERMMEAVHRYEGTVNQVMGDGIMALFGAPLRPRGSRGTRLLRRAAHAGCGQAVRPGSSAHPGVTASYPCRP